MVTLLSVFSLQHRQDTRFLILLYLLLLKIHHSIIELMCYSTLSFDSQGPEQNALGNILVFFLLTGLTVGVTLDWLWLIGKGW